MTEVIRLNILHNPNNQHTDALAPFMFDPQSFQTLTDEMAKLGYILVKESPEIQAFFTDSTIYRILCKGEQIGQVGLAQ